MKFTINSNLYYRDIWFINEEESYGVNFEYRYNGPDAISVTIDTSNMDPESQEEYEFLQDLSPDIKHDEIKLEYPYYGYVNSLFGDELYKSNENLVVWTSFPEFGRDSYYGQLDITSNGIFDNTDRSRIGLMDLSWDNENNRPQVKQTSQESQIIADILLNESWNNDTELENYLKNNHNLEIEDSYITFKFAQIDKN